MHGRFHAIFLLARVAVGLVLLGLALALFLGRSIAPGDEMRWVAALVLGLGAADAACFLVELTRALRSGSGLGRAFSIALASARRTGSVVTAVFAIAYLGLAPQEAGAAASFALLGAAGVLVNTAVLLLGKQVHRAELVPARAADAGGPRSSAQRLAMAIGGGAAVGAVLAIVGWTSLHAPPQRALACPLLPNGVVPGSGLHSSRCPLEPLDRVVEVWVPGDRGPFRGLADLREKAERWPDFMEWTVERDGERVKMTVPLVELRGTHPVGRFTTALLLAGVMLASAGIIAWNSSSGAAVPFLVFYAMVSIWLAAGLCAGSNEYLSLIAALAVAMLAAPLAHLALVFPREREHDASVRGLAGLYYASGGLLCGLTVLGFHGSAEIWILMERLTPVFVFLSWLAVLLSTLAVLHDPASRRERERARMVLLGSACMAALALGIGTLAGAHSEFAYRTGAVVLVPIPVAAALVRYHVFDMHPRLRRLIYSLAYSALAAGVLTLLAVVAAQAQGTGVPFGDTGLLFSSLLLLLLAGEPLREWLLGRARELVSSAARRRRAAAVRCIQQLAELRDPDACARIVAETIVTSLRSSWVVVFLRSPELGLRPSHAIGAGAPLSLDLARCADSLAAAGEVVHLPRVAAGEAIGILLRAGVEVVMPLRSAAGISGLALLGEREDAVPYTLEDLDHLAALGAQTGVALENARLARQLVDAERTAARGNLAVGLAHELGKPLRVIEDIARSLQDGGPVDPLRARRELGTIAEISKELIRSVYGFVREARSRRVRRGASVADVVARAVHSIAHLHGEDRVSVSLAPDLPELAGGDELVTVLSNLLDNALLASRTGDSVHVLATAVEDELRLEVVDDGHGMDDGTAARAFELFFTTRAAQGGTGVGLALCREIVEHLGGGIELRSQPGKGTRACVRLPLLPRLVA